VPGDEPSKEKKMHKYYRVLIVMVVLLAVLAVSLLYKSEVVHSKEEMPSNQSIDDESSAIAVAQSVATINLTGGASLSLVSVRRIGTTEFKELLESEGMSQDPYSLVDEQCGADVGTEDCIWIVTFSGSFSLNRGPTGVPRPVFSTMDVILDARDGSVIGIQLHD
jgi:hypothetical protein